MRPSLLVIALSIAGISGSLQAARPAKAAPEGVHKVRKGDTAGRIAREYGLAMSQLAALNPDRNLSKLSVGMTLKVGAPRKAAPRTPKAEVATHVAQERRTPRTLATPASPIQPLPAIPTPEPVALVHLERLLPATLRAPGSAALPPATPASDAQVLASRIQHVIPHDAGTAEPEVAPVTAQAFLPADPEHLDLFWPVETRTISSAWGPRIRSRVVRGRKDKRKRVRVRYRGSHKGVDLTAPQGTDVYAALDGVVITAGRHRLYGNYVVLDHGNGVVTLYAHHRANHVQEGDIVRRGQRIAEVGRTGNATGPHLHFELRVNGLHRNPFPALNDNEEIPADMVAQNVAAPVRR